MAKSKAKAGKRTRRAAPAVAAASGSAGHYEGKQDYPKAVYGKRPSDGVVVSQRVETAADHAVLLATEPDHQWADSPADHGVETAPAAPAAEPAPIKGQ